MEHFDELEAMRKIAAALEPLDEAARTRALQWAMSRFRALKTTPAFEPTTTPLLDATASVGVSDQHGTFAELFDAARPVTEKDKALVAAYWIQVRESASSFAAQSLNELLKDLGHRVGNITEALSALKNERPALALQLKKSGTTRQARKTYKLTQEGARRVSAMINGASASSESV